MFILISCENLCQYANVNQCVAAEPRFHTIELMNVIL